MSVIEAGGARFVVRDGTTDANTVWACAREDEYGVADIEVEGRTVFDIGAHVGGFGVWMATRGATVVMVEPLPENVGQIHENLILNGVAATVIRGAFGADRVEKLPPGDPHEFVSNIGRAPGPTSVPCQRVTLEEIVAEHGVPDILKLDCEGGEWAALQEQAVDYVPLIVGEYHAFGEWNGARLAALLPQHEVSVGSVPGLGSFRATLRA